MPSVFLDTMRKEEILPEGDFIADLCTGRLQSVVPGPAASPSPGTLLETPIPGPHSRLPESEIQRLKTNNLFLCRPSK